MKIHKFKFEDTEILQIYTTEEEIENKETLNKINQLKKQELNVTVFINGRNNTIKTINEILNYEKSKNIK